MSRINFDKMSKEGQEIVFNNMVEMLVNDYPGIPSKKAAEALKYYVDQYLKYLKEADPASVAYSYNKFIDDLIINVKKNYEDSKDVTCGKSCSNCCKQCVAITYEESVLLYKAMKENNIKISKKRLEIQSRYKPETWHLLKDKYIACVFLDEKTHMCSIYDYRPSACRQHFSVMPPSDCDITKEVGKEVAFWKPFEIQVVASAITMVGSADYMPIHLLERIKENK